MFIIIILILVIDTVMLGIFACKCNPAAQVYLIPMYALQIVGYAALYRIYVKMKLGKREKMQDKIARLREENEKLREQIAIKKGEKPQSSAAR